MKKIINLIALAMLAFGLTGCASDETTITTTISQADTETTTQITTTTITATTTPSISTTITMTDTTAETTTLSGLSLAIESLSNPYNLALFITDDPLTKMGFNFEMPSDKGGYIEIAALGAESFTRHIATEKTRNIGNRTVYLYSCTITELVPGETYVYKATNGDLSETSEEYQFTMPEALADEFSFMFLPDPQETWDYGYRIYAANVISVLEYAETDFDFVMIPGDIVNDADVRSQWNWFFRYSAVFSFNKPLVATAGNHDVSGFDETKIQAMEYDGYLNLPANGPVYSEFAELENDLRLPNFDDGKTYSFDYGHAHFVMLNTEMFCDGTTACPVYDETNAAILEAWLRDDLAATTKQWIIVMLHRGPYSLSYDTVSVRNRLTPIFDEYGVDLVLAGHDHQYSRAIYAYGDLIDFSTAEEPAFGQVSLDEELTETRHFNDYPSEFGTTYLTGNTTGTKFYGGSRDSGISVNYGFSGEYPVISMITVSQTAIEIVSYAIVKATNFTLEPDYVVELEQFTIRNSEMGE